MPVTDPIADYLTRIRNAAKAKKVRVEIPEKKKKIGCYGRTVIKN